jgi:hypothetical protein
MKRQRVLHVASPVMTSTPAHLDSTHADYKPEGSSVAAPATKHLRIQAVPPLLLLALNRYAWHGGGAKSRK